MARRQSRSLPALELSSSITSFIDQRAYEGSAFTEKFYKDQLERALLRWFTAHGKTELGAITPDDVRAYLRAQKDATFTRHGQETKHTLSRGSLIHRYGSAKTFFSWCVDDGRLAHSPMEGLRRPRQAKRVKQPFTREESRALLAEARKAPGLLRFRDPAILTVLLDAGPRANGLLSMSLTCSLCHGPCVEVVWRNGVARTLTGRVTFHEKGSKDVQGRLGPEARRVLNDWLAVMPTIPGGWIWVTQRNSRLSVKSLWAMLRNLGKYAEVEHVHTHKLRHTFATEMMQAHGNVKLVQLRLGHSKLATTETYLSSLGVDYALADNFRTPGEWLK